MIRLTGYLINITLRKRKYPHGRYLLRLFKNKNLRLSLIKSDYVCYLM